MSDEDTAVRDGNNLAEDQTTEEQVALSPEEEAVAKLKEAILVQREEIGPLRYRLTVTVPEDTLHERRSEQYAELKRDAQVPGFRKGHAPLRLIEKRFALDVGQQLKAQLVSNGYLAAVEKENLKPLGEPLFLVKTVEEQIRDDQKPHKVEVEKFVPLERAIDHIPMPREGTLTFRCEFEVTPEFELPELTKIPVRRPAVSIAKEDVDEELRRMRMGRGTFQPVHGGTIHPNDLLTADMKLSADGETIASEENVAIAARDISIRGIPLAGLGDAVKGKKVGASVTIQAVVPDDHENVDIRGKTAQFDFTIHEVKRLVIPPIDADFLASVGFDTEKELRDVIRDSLESRLEATIQEAMREQVGQYLLDHTDLEIPERLSQRQTERSVARRAIAMYQAGIPEAEVQARTDELRAKAQDQVVRDLKLFFVLQRIAEERKIDVSEEQLNAAIANIARQSNKRFDRVRDELSKNDGLFSLYLVLRDRNVLENLLEEAEIVESEAPAKEKTAKKTKKRSSSQPRGQVAKKGKSGK